MDLIAKEFVDRGLKKPYGRLSEAVFEPYFPSRNIQREFQEIAENIGQDNPFESAIDVLQEMYEDFADFDLCMPMDRFRVGEIAQQMSPFLKIPEENNPQQCAPSSYYWS